MEERIKKFRKLEKSFFIAGLVLTIAGFIIAEVGLPFWFIKLGEMTPDIGANSDPIDPSFTQKIDLAILTIVTFVIGFRSMCTGIPFIVVSKAVFRTKARNLEKIQDMGNLPN